MEALLPNDKSWTSSERSDINSLTTPHMMAHPHHPPWGNLDDRMNQLDRSHQPLMHGSAPFRTTTLMNLDNLRMSPSTLKQVSFTMEDIEIVILEKPLRVLMK